MLLQCLEFFTRLRRCAFLPGAIGFQVAIVFVVSQGLFLVVLKFRENTYVGSRFL